MKGLFIVKYFTASTGSWRSRVNSDLNKDLESL